MPDKLKPRILMSYAYLTEDTLDALLPHKDEFTFLIDSGAYTAWTRKKEVDLGAYLTFINLIIEKGFNLEAYLMLDIINDQERTLENYNIMREAGFSPMPIFTRGAPREHLELFYEHTDYVAIGGVFAGSMAEHQYMKAVMTDWVKDRKVHWLGYAKKDFIHYFKPYSFDTSSWSSGIRFGAISLFVGGQEIRANRKNIGIWINNPKIRNLIQRYEIDPDKFRYKETWVNDGKYNGVTDTLAYVGLLSYCDYYRNLEQRGISRGYLAVMNKEQAMGVIRAYKHITKLKGGQQ